VTVADSSGVVPFAFAETRDEFAQNLAAVQQRIDAALARAGRTDSVRLLPVSKTVPSERLRFAIEAGCPRLGENKVQEAQRKSGELADTGVEWAVIGNLQTNKAKFVAQFATEFQALDRIKVAEALDRRLQAEGRGLDVFVQVNTSGEESKFGCDPSEAEALIKQLPQFSSLRVKGLMTLAVFSKDTELVRACFRRLVSLRDQLREVAPDGVSVEELSMGMSGDFEAAIEEGSTVVRVGQAIFGARPTPDSEYWPSAN
jgi:pyridoxal phosphate enzyme (YggS family)